MISDVPPAVLGQQPVVTPGEHETGTSHVGGHLFVIDGDITRLQSDAWLLPTDDHFQIASAFVAAVGMTSPGTLPATHRAEWGTHVVQLLRNDHESDAANSQIWLGRVGAGDLTEPQRLIHCARDFVRLSAADARRRVSDCRPVLAMPLIGSGEGGNRKWRGELLKALIPELVGAAAKNNVDIILVMWGPVAFAAAQAARRFALGGDEWFRQVFVNEIGSELVGRALALANRARSGDLVVFIGAGVSASAGLPAWQQLLDLVALQIDYDPKLLPHLHDLDVRDQAAVLKGDEQNHQRFADAVASSLNAGRYSLLHGLIASLPVNETVTTNFDTLFEVAASTAGRSLAVIPGATIRAGDRWLVKLHGTLGSDLVLTRGEYRNAGLTQGALFGLVQALLITRHMLFVGYSLRDEDFNNLIHEVRAVRSADKGTTSAFGTVLTLFNNPAFAALWPDLDIVASSAQEPTIVADVVQPASMDSLLDSSRRQAILLDLVAAEACSRTSFITDPRYDNLRDEDEASLAAAIEVLRDALSHRKGSRSDWSEVEDFLKTFGIGDD